MSRDLELWNAWQKTKSPIDLEKLLHELDPLIQAEVNRRAGTLARPMLVSQAKKLTVRALKSYEPNRKPPVKISTHVTNQLQKLSRVNYAHQNIARVPEHSMLQFGSVAAAVEDFKIDHGRDPSTLELADTLGWSSRKITQFQKSFGRQELIESGEVPAGMFVAADHDPHITYVYHSMSPRQQKIFEHTTGYGGTKRLDNKSLMRKLGITQGVLSYEKTKIKRLFE